MRVGVLAVALIASVVAGGIWSSLDDDSDVVLRTGPVLDDVRPPTIVTNAALEGDRLPDAAVAALDGSVVRTADLEGAPLVVNVWGSTCGPCKVELPDLAEVHRAYGDRVRFVGISYLAASEREESFARSRGVEYELLYDADGEFLSAAGIGAFPVTLLVAADGTIVAQTGVVDADGLAALIDEVLL